MGLLLGSERFIREEDPETILIRQATECAGLLEDVRNIKILKKKYPKLLNQFSDACARATSNERITAFHSIIQNISGEIKLNTENQMLTKILKNIGSLASVGLNSSRREKVFKEFSFIVANLKNKELVADNELKVKETLVGKELNEFLSKSQPVDYGMRAFIFKMPLNEEPEEFRDIMVEEGMDSTTDTSAIKLLKIYRAGTANLEYARQLKAYELLEQARKKDINNNNSVAFVPKPFFAKDIVLDSSITNKLHIHENKGRVELLMMDFINGRDIQYLLLSKALLLKNNESYDSLNTYQLYDLASQEFGFAPILPSTPSSERWKIGTKNMDIIYNFLKSKSVKINTKVVTQLKNGLKIFEKAEFIHGDLHERNIMYEGSAESFFTEDAEEGKSFVIDFDAFPEEESVYPSTDDKLVLDRLAGLNA